jgi:hypothetical protein
VGLTPAKYEGQAAPTSRPDPIAASVAALVALVAMVGCGQSSTAALPSRRPAATQATRPAAPDVVRAYLAALNTHDITTAASLLTSRHAHLVEAEADSWFTNVISIVDVKTGAAAEQTGDRASPYTAGYRDVVRVGVTFTLEQKHVASMDNGPTSWGYVLVRNSDAQPWLIADEGMP